MNHSIHNKNEFPPFQYLHRLSPPPPGSGELLEHRRAIWDTISLNISRPSLLTGVGVFSPQGGGSESIVCVDARPLVEPLRELDVATRLEAENFVGPDGVEDERRITVFSKVFRCKYVRGVLQ